MSEMIRTTRNTFDTLKAKLGPRSDLIAKIEAGAKIRAQEVAFTIEPNTAEAQAIATVLNSHGEGGRMGQALDRIRAMCLGQSGATRTETETSESGRVTTTEVPADEPKRETPSAAASAEQDAKDTEAAFAASNFVSWREQFGKLYAEGALAPEEKKKK